MNLSMPTPLAGPLIALFITALTHLITTGWTWPDPQEPDGDEP